MNTQTYKTIGPVIAFAGLVLLSALFVFAFFPDRLPLINIVSNGYPIVLAMMATGISSRIYRSLPKGRYARRLWGTLIAAFGCWAIGEILWSVYEFVLKLDIYPSLADLFYLIGDITLAIFFASQVGFLRIVLRGWKRVLTIALILVFVIWAGYFVIGPMLPQWRRNPAELGVSLLYETTHIVLLSGATMLTLGLLEGFLGRRWIVLAVGLWTNILANQIFFYATWNNLYYPNDQVTLASVIFDLLYIASYLLILIGLYLRWALPFPTIHVEEALARGAQPVSRAVGVLISDSGGRAFFVDPRLLPVLQISEIGESTGEFVGNILGIKTNLDQEIVGEVLRRGYAQPRRVILGGQLYTLQAFQEPGAATEIYWLLVPGEAEIPLHPGERPPLETLLAQAIRGNGEITSPETLCETYLETVGSTLSVLCARFGGTAIGEEWSTQFKKLIDVCRTDQKSGLPADMEACRSQFQSMLERALMIAPAEQVYDALERVDVAIGEETLRAVKAAGLHLSSLLLGERKG